MTTSKKMMTSNLSLEVRHSVWALMIAGMYGFGDHVEDPRAIRARSRTYAIGRIANGAWR